MKKLNRVINCPWRVTCSKCGSYEVYSRHEKITRADNPEEYKGEELICDNCNNEGSIVYDKKQNKTVHYETLL